MFPMSNAAGVRLQVIVAHPDDETFGCGSLLLHCRGAGASTAVCCATRGEAGQVARGVETPPGGVGELREGELRAAADLLGVERVDLLGYLDSGMDGDARPGSLMAAEASLVRADIGRAVDAFRPDVIVTLDGSDGHRDHARVRDVVIEVAAKRGVPVYLQCLPRSVMKQWAEHMSREHSDSVYLALGELGTPDDEITHVVETGEFWQQRWTAIRAHRSQSSPFDGLPDGLARAFLCREHLSVVQTPSSPATPRQEQRDRSTTGR
jgi:LmbE family N-acetylglucosaminyl deacetylase